MAYSFTPTMKPFVISSLYESIKATKPRQRMPNTQYNMSAQVVNGGNRFICIQSGVTGAGTGPSGSSGTSFDGSVRWLAMGPDQIQDGDIVSNLYVAIGKQTEWTNPAEPDVPDTSYNGEMQALDDVTAFLRIDAINLRLGIRNSAWSSGTEYSQYDPSTNQLHYPSPHYCIVGDTFVYKCIDNNGGVPSVDPPSGTSNSFIETADGYIWKYIGEIPSTEQFDFATSMFVPAPTGLAVGSYVRGEISTFTNLIQYGDSFDEAAVIQTAVFGDGVGANAAVRTSVAGGSKSVTGMYASSGGIDYSEAVAVAWDSSAEGAGASINVIIDSGEIESISVNATGSDYTDATVLIIGDGQGAEASANVVGGSVTSVSVENGGSGYTWAKAYIVPGTGGAIATAILSPVNGHGSNITSELGVSSLLISTKLTPALSRYIPTEPTDPDGSFRQVSLVSGVQGTSTSERNAEAYLGKAHYKFDSPGSLNKYKDGSGYVLYMNNISSIVHTSSQEEIIKISISL